MKSLTAFLAIILKPIKTYDNITITLGLYTMIHIQPVFLIHGIAQTDTVIGG